ncbi:MAG TPA: HEAT repeat domain-containing protein, partial [candidate division Zixibacteria bacterium]|nr:HEAT repeat domain-containing protein [candidate division Zixibacteria bacterium]
MMERDEAIAGHLAALECEDKMVIRRGVDGLIALAGRSPGLVPLLRELLSDPRRKHRWALAYVLGHVAPPAPAAVEALLEALGHPEPDIRWAVALLLIRLGKSHPAIAANLVALSRDGTATQRRMAVYCIRDVGVPGPPARAALVRALGDTDPLVRLAALAAFKNCTGPDAEVERLFLGLFLRDPHDGVRNA